MTAGIPEKANQAVLSATPLGRMGAPVKVAPGALFLTG